MSLRLTASEWADLQKRGLRVARVKQEGAPKVKDPAPKLEPQRDPIHLDHRVGWVPLWLWLAVGEWPSPPKFKSKLEAAYAAYLDALKLAGDIDSWAYEPIVLRLADRTEYTPDFVILKDHRLETIEVKGFMRSRDSVRVKVARDLYPDLHLRVVRRVKGVWI